MNGRQLSRRSALRLLAISAATTTCSACALNPFYVAEERPPAASELLAFRPARKGRAEVVPAAGGIARQVVLKQQYLKLVSGRRGSDVVVGEKFSAAPREADGGISVAELSDKKIAALLRDPRVKELATQTLTTLLGMPAYYVGAGQLASPDIPLLTMTPSLLDDDRIRIAFASGTAAVLTQSFELDLERNRWYAILLDVARSPDGAGAREHLFCLRVELT